ncbi:hypothetical protein ATANTOWER_000308 [Ataeniobius toweri]|uniref:Uncharacterized protein n=1 Tax=Ataeniobius toweri TaxID=208326 RepID=A0ABU7ADC6_9TELE|nr:hypothetical protein [Ataeniobius toweri]
MYPFTYAHFGTHNIDSQAQFQEYRTSKHLQEIKLVYVTVCTITISSLRSTQPKMLQLANFYDYKPIPVTHFCLAGESKWISLILSRAYPSGPSTNIHYLKFLLNSIQV